MFTLQRRGYRTARRKSSGEKEVEVVKSQSVKSLETLEENHKIVYGITKILKVSKGEVVANTRRIRFKESLEGCNAVE